MSVQPDTTTTATSAGPLEGVTIVEMGSLLAGPFAGRLAADLGATVIKIETPDRLDPMRDWGRGTHNGRALWWPVISRNKLCVTLNLRTEEGQHLLLDLLEYTDAVIENFRPGTLDRWNLSYERMKRANDRLVMVRVSGYGQTGPYSERPGFAAVGEAMGGLRFLNGEQGELPPRMGVSLGDSLAAMFAFQGLMTALYQRDALGGQGQEVDVSILESCFAMLESIAPEYDLLGKVRQPTGTRLDGIAPSNVYRASDGVPMVIAANKDTLFARLCDAMDRPELAADPRYLDHASRGHNQDELDATIAEWAGRHTAAEIDAKLSGAGVVCGPIYSIEDIFADPQVAAREMLVEHTDPELGTFRGPGITPKFVDTPGAVRWPGPWEPGAHNQQVFGGMLDRGDDELERLADAGVI